MKAIAYLAFLGSLLTVSPSVAWACDAGIQTFQRSGIYNGRDYSSITINFDTQRITMNFADGGQFTLALPDQAAFEQVAETLLGREVSSNC